MLERLFGYHCTGCTCFDEQPVEAATVESADEPEVEELGELPVANESDPQSPPHVHEWGLWEIVKEGSITQTGSWSHSDRELGTYLDQRRRCTTCGKYELDTQVSYAVEE